jgi:BirA family transcriptional regulator, biotin operon repressor / biotin---[acetyl-CoA-carboxylase] ligase
MNSLNNLIPLFSSPNLFKWVDEVGSTMDLAADTVAINVADFTPNSFGLVAANKQNSGRGRLNRKWHSETDNFLGTFIVGFKGEVTRLSGLSLAVGILIAEIFISLGGKPKLKWPNDILTEKGEKIGGILIEIKNISDFQAVLIGVGLNIKSSPNLKNSEKSNSTIHPSSSIFKSWGIQTDKVEIATRIAQSLKENLPTFFLNGFDNFRIRWLELNYNLKEFLINLDNSLEKANFIDVTKSGSLIIKIKGDTREIFSGEIFF